MSIDENSGRVSYTVKELLARMEGKIDVTNARLSQIEHAIAGAATIAALATAESRITLLEQQVVRREGPIIQEIRSFERKVDQIASQALTKDKISEALKEEAERLISLGGRMSSRAVGKTQMRLGFFGIFVSIVLAVAGLVSDHL